MFACAVIGKRVKILEEENWQQCIALAGRRLGCDCAASLGFKTGLPMSSSISLGSGEQGQGQVSVCMLTHLVLKEQDVVKLACEFLNNREMHISQVTLERESGVINGNYSDDLLFLR